METAIQDKDAEAYLGHPPLVVRLRPVIEMSEDQFLEFCELNRDLRIERNALGELIIMPPTMGMTGAYNADITMQLALWAKRDGTGKTFDSSTGFRLPNSAVRAPDGSWVAKSRLEQLTPEQWMKFLPLCPEFVIELRSLTDSLAVTKAKMAEYIENGAQLGWLIDPLQKRVHVYRPGEAVEVLDAPEAVSGDPLLPGFTLDLREVW